MQADGSRRSGGASKARVSVYERVTERITDLLQQGTVPWRKPWNAHVGPPRNGVSGRYYRGLNVFMLSAAGFDSPWWFSPRQVNALGGHIKKGEKVSWAHFWKPWVPKGGPSETPEVDADKAEISTRRRPALIIRAYRVVNCDQCEGSRGRQIPRQTSCRNTAEKRQRRDRSLRRRSLPGCRIHRPFGSVATGRSTGRGPTRFTCRSAKPSRLRKSFTRPRFTSSSIRPGHRERLNRKTLTDGTPFGSPTYTREELLAEMGRRLPVRRSWHRGSHHRQLRRLHCGLAEFSQVRSEGPGRRRRSSAEGGRPRAGLGRTRRGRGRRRKRGGSGLNDPGHRPRPLAGGPGTRVLPVRSLP